MSEIDNNNEELNDAVELEIEDSTELVAPVDSSLSISGAAADARTVGERFQAVEGRTGETISYSTEVGSPTIKAAIDAVSARTGADIPLSGTDITTIADNIGDINTAMTALGARTGADIPLSGGDATTIAEKIAEITQDVDERTADQIALTADDDTTITEALAEKVASVNHNLPDSNGNVAITEVDGANQLISSMSTTNNGEFIARSTAGDASVGNGSAWLMTVQGNRIHEGYVAEELEMTVSGEDIEAVINRATFVSYVDESGTTILIYSGGEWNNDPALYGVTVTGTPENGDYITITYVKEERGTITHANPSRFVSTGWNLYNHAHRYARVVDYSESYDYMIAGTYASLSWSETEDGELETITPIGGHFTVPGDGYVHVTGGNEIDTAIWMTWSDWSEEYDGDFALYTVSSLDLSDIMARYFPFGLMRVGNHRDEINLNVGIATSRITRMDYSAVNLAAAIATGRDYEYDDNYIYIVRETESVYSIGTVTESVQANDHGMEIFEGTEVPVQAYIMYGVNLKNRLERDVLTISQQTLTTAQQTQARTNIGAASTDAVSSLSSQLATFKFTVIASNSDLNNCTEYGLYSCASSVVAATLTNSPVTSIGFGMLVMGKGSTQHIQVIFTGSSIFLRHQSGGTWMSWYKFTGTAVS